MIKHYYHLTKPGIIYGNSIAAIAGFLLASQGHFNVQLFVAMLVGLALVIAAACVFNNVYDKDIDIKMERTKNREMVTGQISKRSALIFGIVLIILGTTTLWKFTNPYALGAALLGFFVYVFLYTPLKRKTTFSTLIGAVSGATPPVVGYAAVTHSYGIGALLLFLVLVFWQMPHFYGISLYRQKDYKEAGVPTLPETKGVWFTKMNIAIYTLLLVITAAYLRWFGIAGTSYFLAVLLLCLIWMYRGFVQFKQLDSALWGKKMFLFSLIVLLAQSFVLSLNHWLP